MIKKIYMGIGNHVVCLHQATGQEIWRTQVKTSALVSILVSGDTVFASSSGHMYALSAANGAVKWENGLEGLGYGVATLAVDGTSSSIEGQSAEATRDDS
jgi:outer membrane protein assembly factor BamB